MSTKHPMQKQYLTENGVRRFIENKLVSWLIDQLPNNMNDLAKEFYVGGYDKDDYDQILQLIGYSVSGIPYKNKDLYDITDNCNHLHDDRGNLVECNDIAKEVEEQQLNRLPEANK